MKEKLAELERLLTSRHVLEGSGTRWVIHPTVEDLRRVMLIMLDILASHTVTLEDLPLHGNDKHTGYFGNEPQL